LHPVNGVETVILGKVSSMLARLRCFLRDHHNPTRHPLGGFKCSDCGATGADLEEMGFEDAGYVPARRTGSY
jgi:hypothetical protein